MDRHYARAYERRLRRKPTSSFAKALPHMPRQVSTVARQRETSARRQRSTGSSAGDPPREPDDEPPLAPPRRLTVTRACSTCEGPLDARRSTRRYCSSPCRQAAYRNRRARRNGHNGAVQLTPELRAWLRYEIDRRARRKLDALGGYAHVERAERDLERELQVAA